jgi:hypothetical protein
MTETTVVSEWDAERFHQKVVELEGQGYIARLESYRIAAEMNPETGIVSHVHSIELSRPGSVEDSSVEDSSGRAG